ncbi:hypothetical protein K3495_g11150 [Podosphaera aphanis]|nr:hypothetical protein K3495_g11150 [Podosphaera aphanis]
MLDNGMTLSSSPGVTTHTRGNTLDLVWSNAGAIADVAPELGSTSDHMTLSGDVPRPNARGAAAIRLNSPIRVSDDALEDFTKVVAEWSKDIGRQELQTASDLDNLGNDLVEILSDAIKATWRRSSPQPGQSAPWWTEECREAKGLYRALNDDDSRKAFRRTVKKAKRHYWRRKFSEAQTDTDMYRLARWAKPRQQGTTAPLRTVNGFESDPRRRATLLRDLLLARFTRENDIEVTNDLTDFEPDANHLPWSTEVTEEESRWAATSCQDKAPGANNITVRLLRAAWPAVGHAVRALYEVSLRLKHFPSVFKLAEVILIPKSGRDLSTAKGWRPIALLSCLGKGLERLVAKRIAHTALCSQKLPQQLIGALPGRSANDLVACLVHDVEHALSLRHKAVLVTLDVQGAFDATLHGRLLRRMKETGWTTETISWTASFLQGRSARVRYDGGVTDAVELECGLPQGSPLSPILFLLYMSEVAGGSNWRFGYADDLAVLGIGATANLAAEAAQREVNTITAWAESNAVAFDPAKAEVLYFLGPRARITDLPPIIIRDVAIQESKTVRWLGVFLDRGLTFRHHVSEWTKKSTRLVQHIRRLSKCTQGPPPGPLTTVIRTVVMPIALLAAEVWWPGSTRDTFRGEMHNSCRMQIEAIDRVLISGIRAALPTWRTMPAAALRRETGIPPAKVLLEERRLLAAARIRRLDEYHPLRLRALESTASARR